MFISAFQFVFINSQHVVPVAVSTVLSSVVLLHQTFTVQFFPSPNWFVSPKKNLRKTKTVLLSLLVKLPTTNVLQFQKVSKSVHSVLLKPSVHVLLQLVVKFLLSTNLLSNAHVVPTVSSSVAVKPSVLQLNTSVFPVFQVPTHVHVLSPKVVNQNVHVVVGKQNKCYLFIIIHNFLYYYITMYYSLYRRFFLQPSLSF